MKKIRLKPYNLTGKKVSIDQTPLIEGQTLQKVKIQRDLFKINQEKFSSEEHGTKYL